MIDNSGMSYNVPLFFVILNVPGNVDSYLFKIFPLSGSRKLDTLLTKSYP